MQVEVCPLPHGFPQSAHTHEGSGIDSDEAVIVPITNPDKKITVIITGYILFFTDNMVASSFGISFFLLQRCKLPRYSFVRTSCLF